MVNQSALHPSLFLVFPSSQTSLAETYSFPHNSTQLPTKVSPVNPAGHVTLREIVVPPITFFLKPFKSTKAYDANALDGIMTSVGFAAVLQ